MPRRTASTLRHDAWGASFQQPDSAGKAVELTEPDDQFGFCLLSASNQVVAATDRASRLLNYPRSERTQLNENCMQKIRALANTRQRADGTTWRAVLRSGRRHYRCRAIPFVAQTTVPLSMPTLLLIERPGASQTTLSRMATDFHLTARQVELVSLLARGLTNKQIAGVLSLSAHTVKTHLHVIMVKLGTSTRAGVVGALIARMA
jgi:DNA-binding CsgD family transcriptional regulator